MKYPLLLPIIGHGATDIVDLPIKTLSAHFLSSVLIYNLDLLNRKRLLLTGSIIHISRDIPSQYNLLLSSGLHILWLWKPIVAKLYLLIIHTPLHYIRNYKNSSNREYIMKSSVVSLSTILSIYVLNNNIDNYLDMLFGKLWWVAPIIAHIFINEQLQIKYNK